MRLASIFAIFVCVVAFASAHVYFKETFDGKLHLLEDILMQLESEKERY